ncbi:MAG: Mbeg1-like protein [Lachnospiraceae bacterium]|nr:Mbeg1-like protein [Lachnospiraceae bacterium]
MANIMDYLDWRGDIPFEVDGYNEVDNLVFSTMAYIDFDGVVGGMEDDKPLSIDQVNDRYWRLHSEKEIKDRKAFVSDAPFILKKMAGSRRYRDMRLLHYINAVDENLTLQLSAITIIPGDGSVYVAYRGTDDSLIGWKEDFLFAYKDMTVGQRASVEYLDTTLNSLPGDLITYVGGHSKGGNFAVFAAAFCNQHIRDRIKSVYSNDGPGFVSEVIHTREYQGIKDKIVKYTPEFSFIGALMTEDADSIIVKSDENGAYQHDPFSWQVMRNHLVRSDDMTSSSKLLNDTLGRWVSNEPMEKRALFIDILFDLFKEAGVTKASELGKNRIKTSVAMVNALRKLPADDRMEFLGILKDLAKSGGDALKDAILDVETEARNNTW